MLFNQWGLTVLYDPWDAPQSRAQAAEGARWLMGTVSPASRSPEIHAHRRSRGGLSDTQSKLSSDVRFWLHKSEVVLTLAIDCKRPKITLGNGPVNIELDELLFPWATNRRIRVDGGTLVIEFEKLFLRPSEYPKETDIAIGTTMLEELANAIWKEQEFVEW